MGVILRFPPEKRTTEIEKDLIRREIKSRIENGNFDSFIYIVPTRRKIRELRRELLEFSNNNALPELNLFTLDLFAQALYYSAKLEKPKRLISDTIQSLVFQVAIENVIHELEYFKPPDEIKNKELPKGTLNKIIDTIIGLKEDGIYPEKLIDEVEKTKKSEDKKKLKDLAKIYEQYERILISNGFIDVPGIFQELNNLLNSKDVNTNFRSAFYNVDVIFIEGFSMFRLPEIELIKSLKGVEDLTIIIFFDYFERNDNLFGHLNECYNKFIEAGFARYEIKERTKTDKFAVHINKYLFNHNNSKFEGKYDAKDRVTLVEAKDRIDEVRTIARIIKKIVRERPDIDLSKICVATYRPEKYTNLFREIFPIYGIPANITDRYYLERSPLVSSIISLLEIPVNEYRIDEIIKVLMSPYFDFSAAVGRNLSADNIYSVSKELKIKRGRDYWCESVKNRIKVISSKIDSTNDQDEREQLLREKKLLEDALNDYENFVTKIVDNFNETMKPSEFKNKLNEVLNQLKVSQQILKVPRRIATHNEVERDARAYQKFIEVVDELLEVFEFSMKRKEKYSLGYYVELIKKALPRVRYNIRQKYGYGVYVTALEETRGLDFDVMIIAGLVDTEFPSVYEPEVFLSEGLRKTRKMHKLDERYLFYQGVVNFKTHLYLTYPKMDAENELVRSSFIDSLEQVIEFEKVDSSVFGDWIYSKDELYERYGRFLKFNLDKLNTFDFVSKRFKKLVKNYEDNFRHILEVSKINISRSESDKDDYREYKGFIEPADEERLKLKEQGDKIFSISQIETYAKCPYRYFVERVLTLKKIEEIEEFITPIERGILYHEVLYKFYTEWSKREKSIRKNENEAIQLIEKIAREKSKEFEVNHPLWEIEKRELIRSMINFVKEESKSDSSFKPTYFEVAFGPKVGARRNIDENLSTIEPIQLGKVKIQGKIDRIDVGDAGFIICDYKTGKSRISFNQVEKGIHLQIPLYIKIAEEIFNQKGKSIKGLGGYSYIVRGNVERVDVMIQEKIKTKKKNSSKVFNQDDFKLKIEEAVNKVNEFVDKITNGIFNLTEHDDEIQNICGNCPYIEICRINEVKFGIQIKSWG
ncbi:MAG: exodeoxyribonuclease V subunit gamma [Candidatus Kryptonium sp.]|nr:exodeoxyribonuclease V subunit gamma [Candidatus Kryptonium sp.]